MFNKKAEADISARKVIFYMVFGIMMTIVFLFIVLVVPSKSSEIAEIPEGREDFILIERFFSSPSCFAFQDKETFRIVPNSIDLEKFNQQNMNSCYESIGKTKAYKLTLNFEDKVTLQTQNWEGFLKDSFSRNVYVYSEDKVKRIKLMVEVQDAT